MDAQVETAKLWIWIRSPRSALGNRTMRIKYDTDSDNHGACFTRTSNVMHWRSGFGPCGQVPESILSPQFFFTLWAQHVDITYQTHGDPHDAHHPSIKKRLTFVSVSCPYGLSAIPSSLGSRFIDLREIFPNRNVFSWNGFIGIWIDCDLHAQLTQWWQPRMPVIFNSSRIAECTYKIRKQCLLAFIADINGSMSGFPGV